MRRVLEVLLRRERRPLGTGWPTCRTDAMRWASIGIILPSPLAAAKLPTDFNRPRSSTLFSHRGNRDRSHSNRYLHGNRSTTTPDQLVGALERRGLFGKPDFSTAEGFQIASEKALAAARGLVGEISAMVNKTPSAEIAVKMDELSDVLCQVADLAECIRLVHPDSSFRDAAQRASLAMNACVEELNTDIRLHRSLLHFITSEEFEKSDPVTQRTTRLLMHDFETCGIHLASAKREKVVKLNNRILELSHQFMEDANLPTLVPRNQCPEALAKHFSTTRDGSHVAVDHVPYHSPDSELRSLGYALYFAELPTQVKIFEEMLRRRHDVSVIAGYESFAHKTLKTCMVGNPETAVRFLEELSEKNLPLAREEVEEMKRFRPSNNDQSPLQLCDVNICTSEARKKIFQSKSSELRKYFSLQTTLQGLARLFQRLFGVTMETVPAHPGEVWSDDVMKLAFTGEDGELLGYTYCDLFTREGKTMSDCHFTIQGGRRKTNGEYQIPIIALCCNFSQSQCGSRGNDPLLSLSAVENLFHEMGHALHSVLGRSRFQNVTGTRCSTDFAEVPSTLMELFLSDSRVLQSFARHHETGRPIHGSDMSTVQLSAGVFPAYDLQLQIVYALTDLLLHSRGPSKLSPLQLAHDIYCRYAPFPSLPGATWVLRFNHFYGYGARYYSYLWARAVSNLVWKIRFASDPFSRESGGGLRNMLSFGGGLPPNELVRDLLNFEPSVSDLVDTLHVSVLEHRRKLTQLSTDHSV